MASEIPGHLMAEISLRLPTLEDIARVSAASSPTAPSSAASAASTPRHSSASSTSKASTPPSRPTPPRPPPRPSPPPPTSPSPSCHPTAGGSCRTSVTAASSSAATTEKMSGPLVSGDLVVCDPLHRQYVLLPSVPDALGDSVESFLMPLGEDDAAAPFKVICVGHCGTRLTVFVFSSTTGQWQAAVSKCWSDLSCKPINPLFMMRHYAYGCFYWDSTIIKRKELLVLDTRRMGFSITHLPSRGWGGMPGVAIVEAGEGKLGMFGIHDEPAGAKPDLCYSIRRGNKGESSGQWQMVNTIPIRSGRRHYINAATERYFLLISSDGPQYVGSSLKMPDLEYFSMDVKKLQLERVCVKPSVSAFSVARIYTNFPPSLLSSPTI